MSGLRALSRYARAHRLRASERERCELCSAPIGDSHAHVADVERAAPLCACRACALLFERPAVAGGRFRKIPDRILRDPEVDLRARAWAALGVPVGIASLQYRSPQGRWVALFPSPAGMAEAAIDSGAQRGLAGATPLAAMAAPDVEALLLWRRRGQDAGACYLVPIDRCYELVARVRRNWEGLQGGGVTREVEAFVADLHRQSRPVSRAERDAS